MSFYTSLSGLKAAQTDLNTISNNIANVSSIGFKGSRANFSDLISASADQSGNVTGSGVAVDGISQQFTQGGFETTDRALDLAISGQGFFVTKSSTGLSYTRDGAFSVDSNRMLVDSSGADVQVLPVDSSGNITATGLSSGQNLQVPLTSGTPKATSAIDLTATLPSDADLPAGRSQYTTGGATYAFNRNDPNSYNYSSSTTVYDSDGNPLQATVYYTRTSVPSSSDPNSTWQARMYIGDQAASADGSATTSPAAPLTLTFGADGSLTSPSAATAFSTVTPTGASAPLTVSLDYGAATQQSASTFTTGAVSQDGKAAGQLNNVAVGSNGLVTATYSDGSTLNLGSVMVANFANPNGLRQLGNSSWGATGLSGDPIVSTAGSGSAGSIQSGALEEANVDITEQLVSLISAQRNFSANAKAIETSNTMNDAIVNLRT
jgi:flagellar hook protein FlgE